MLLSSTLQYALRALGSMAQLPEGEPIFARDLASKASVPASYLAKILNTLGRAGLVDGTRGLRGGYRLTRRPREISLRQVYEALEPGALDQVCFLHSGRACSEREACPIHHRWREIREQFLSFVESSTLEDLAPGASGLPRESWIEETDESELRQASKRATMGRLGLTE